VLVVRKYQRGGEERGCRRRPERMKDEKGFTVPPTHAGNEVRKWHFRCIFERSYTYYCE